eukprot:gnl/TRDRNA2_/TRDRNA2_83124_c0_seq1.p1 gnl/TRDRNA2_/TRDRNA2_83124_c0~~gnl/TRDRNA2_/TRDRNA2_83124_c0_seq1.p1  ORF type:complete len:422 (-),score=66.69 gnl/TRDRNA2_/TRDRNA2_83124_c0_seq1:137-1402(-)
MSLCWAGYGGGQPPQVDALQSLQDQMAKLLVGCGSEQLQTSARAADKVLEQGPTAIRDKEEREKTLASIATGTGDLSPCVVCCQPATRRCSRCQHVVYCGPDCARRHWKEGGHRETCTSDPRNFQLDRVPPAAPPLAVTLAAVGSSADFAAKHRSGEGLPIVLRSTVSKGNLGSAWDLDRLVEAFGPEKLEARFYRGVAQSPDLWTRAGYCDSELVTAAQFAKLIRSGEARRDDVYVNCEVGRTKPGCRLAKDLATIGKRLGLETTSLLGEQVNVWWGAPGHTEPLHCDANDGTLLQLRGRKRVVLFPASQWLNLYPFPMSARMNWAWSRVSLKNVDVRSYPNIRQALPLRMEVVLEEGDVLFIPACWAHHITGLETAESTGEEAHILSVNRFWKTGVERPSEFLPQDVVAVFKQLFPNGL